MEKKSRVEFLYENSFKATYRKAVKRQQLTKFDNRHEGFTSLHHMVYNNPEDPFYDYRLFSFLSSMGIPPTDYLGEEKTPREVAFRFLVECDPTPNKENLQWLLGLYRNQLISYTPDNPDAIRETTYINHHFYEDLYTTVKSSLETFAFLKKTNVLSESKRDINKYPDYQTLNEVVLPYMMMGDEGEDNVHTLDTKELRCIQNHQHFIEKNKEYDESIGRAELVFENKDWVIVITHDKEANVQFGKYTAWCTAGTRHGSMFDSYHGRGELFVLVKKGCGSKQAIKKDPSVRLQFHFEDQQYMDAPDRPIDINTFLFDNKEVKNFFKGYIVKKVLPKRQERNKVNDDINFLMKLGYGDEIIKMLKDSKPKKLDFSGNKMDADLLRDIGDITSLEVLDFSDCGLTELPDSIRSLVNLKYLKLRNNQITNPPSWLNELKSLTFLDLSGCRLEKTIDLTGLDNLTDIVLDYNPKLKYAPSGIGTLSKLARFTASNCDIRSIPEEILNCGELFLIDIHANSKLTTLPEKISGLQNIVAICVDDTDISPDLLKRINANKRSMEVTIIKYDN